MSLLQIAKAVNIDGLHQSINSLFSDLDGMLSEPSGGYSLFGSNIYNTVHNQLFPSLTLL